MNKIKVLFFATFRDKTGKKEETVEIPEGITVKTFKENMGFMLVAVNKDFAFDEDTIPDDAEVALFPPVSGGSGFPTVFEITKEELNLNSLLDEITLPSTGAACFFTGMVRSVTKRDKGLETDYLEYQAYKPMAEAKMQQVADEIREKWPSVEGIAIVQRIGVLYPGTLTVMIACTAGHRDTGVFEAARYGIDRLKQIIPVWKKEVGIGGEEWVEGEYIPRPGE
ncbi:molybdenum cofactor biosynthesis protein MoaE [Chloroflexota bacterium]